MTLATASSESKPEAATVKPIIDGASLLVNTYVHYRKYKNLSENPQVSCVFTLDLNTTLQIDAVAEELRDEAALAAQEHMVKQEPDFANFFDEDTRFFKITPQWMRLRDYSNGGIPDDTIWTND